MAKYEKGCKRAIAQCKSLISPFESITPPTVSQVGISLTSNFIYVIAMLKTTPLIVTIGLSLTIPLSVIGDFLLDTPVNGQVMVGAALVVFSFVVVGIDNARRPEPLEQGKYVDELGTEAA
jgi:hypothetical protein